MRWANCRTESENHAILDRAYNYLDTCVHCGDRVKSQLNSEAEPDYEREGMSPTIEPKCIRQ